MSGKYSAEWWEKVARSHREKPTAARIFDHR
jgi:hypothetical protein